MHYLDNTVNQPETCLELQNDANRLNKPELLIKAKNSYACQKKHDKSKDKKEKCKKYIDAYTSTIDESLRDDIRTNMENLGCDHIPGTLGGRRKRGKRTKRKSKKSRKSRRKKTNRARK